jgi:hypothetical protein
MAGPLEEWMRQQHIPAILATGCFVQIHFDHAASGFRTVYLAATRADLDRYLTQHAEHFRADFQRQFADGVQVSRAIWEEVENWQARSSG